MIYKAGGQNVFSTKPDAYHRTTVEEILQAQPEFLILPTEDQQAYARLIEVHPMLYNTPADVADQAFLIAPDLLYRPGPRLLTGLLQLTNLLHSGLTPDYFLEKN